MYYVRWLLYYVGSMAVVIMVFIKLPVYRAPFAAGGVVFCIDFRIIVAAGAQREKEERSPARRGEWV